MLRNPGIPVVATIPGKPFQVGQTLIQVHGIPLSSCNRFNVNLVCGPQPEISDVALQISPRFDLNWTVRNSRLRKQWGEEECLATSKFPFRRKEPFILEIYATVDAFLVAVDGRHYCEYRYRTPCRTVDTLHIQGDVKISLVEFKSSAVYPSIPAALMAPISPSLSPIQPVGVSCVTQSIPFVSPINECWTVGGEIQVYGRIKAFPNRFHVNLQQGCLTYPHPSIALHVNPRFFCDRREIILNSWFGRWGVEEKITGRRNLFRPNASFILIIRHQPSGFQVLVDNIQVATFAHRMSADLIDSISIDGDVVLHRVVAL